jgi:hypothetical protein
MLRINASARACVRRRLARPPISLVALAALGDRPGMLAPIDGERAADIDHLLE